MAVTYPVRLSSVPQLKRPYLIAAWPGMGGVATIAVNYLRQKLGAREMGDIEPHSFFSPSQVTVTDYVVQLPGFPSSRFFYWDQGEVHDLMIFLGDAQPDRGYEFCHRVMDVAMEFGVERIYTNAAFVLYIRPSRSPRVWGTATTPQLIEYLKSYEVMLMEKGSIGGLNGLLLAVARERGLEGVGLLGEIPVFATQVANPKASRAVLGVLTRMVGVDVDFGELSEWVKQVEPVMGKLYEALPHHGKEAIERFEALMADLEANEELFDEIERFLHDSGNIESQG